MLDPANLVVRTLGPATLPSPLGLSTRPGDWVPDYVPDDVRVQLETEVRGAGVANPTLSFEKAGPRERIFFDPTRTRAGVVTCGGLSPGLNNVLRALVLELHHRYGVADILGYRFGYEGLGPDAAPSVVLDPASVRFIHEEGGSILGVGRGRQDVGAMVDTLVRDRINLFFVIGGDGTLRGALAIADEIERRGLPIAVVGLPKTIDNDVPFVDRTFGFETAVEVARDALRAAHTEAVSARYGIGLVKLMGRDAGFIAANATLASSDVNFCLVPEVPFELDGEAGLLVALERRLKERGHALVVVAEGCGASLAGSSAERDASGNLRYASADLDIGPRLKDSIVGYFAERKLPISLKYIDPSYTIRACPANAGDRVFCEQLARNAVHAAMAGKTAVVIGRWNGAFTHVPLRVLQSRKQRIDPDGELWLAVCSTTGQPRFLRASP